MNEYENPAQPDVPIYGRPDAPPQPPAVVEEPARLGPVQRFFGVLFSPGETFQDINRKPSVIVPLIIIIAAGIAFTLFLTSHFAESWDQFMRQTVIERAARSGQQPTDEDIANAIKFGKIVPFVIAVIGGPLYYLILSGIYTLGLMFIQAQTTFKKIYSVLLWSGATTGVVQAIVSVASAMTLDSEARREFNPRNMGGLSPTNLAALLPADSGPALRAAASAVDIFSIWFLILLVIGFAAIGGARSITTAKTARLVFGLWILGILLRVCWAALMG